PGGFCLVYFFTFFFVALQRNLNFRSGGSDFSSTACKLMKDRVEKVGARGTEIVGLPINIEDLKNYHHLNFKTDA
ncbi:unnamed protein product, partial [marine sediment metagenome]